MDIIPIENSRVHLTPKPGVDGSDYINATWVSGEHIILYPYQLRFSRMQFNFLLQITMPYF